MATQFDYFGFRYEIIKDKKNEVALIDATRGEGRVVVPKQVEFEGKTYTVTVIGCRTETDYYNKETDKRKKALWVEKGTISVGAFSKTSTQRWDTKVSDLLGSWYNKYRKIVDNVSVTSVKLPDSIKTIEEKAFYKCRKLEDINIPDSVTAIGWSAFCGCSSLKEIIIPNSVTSIKGSAFYGCSSLKEITIPNSVTSIGGSAFRACSSLKEITIPDSVNSIEEEVFCDCSSLQEITIPDSVTSIGGWAFLCCTSLKEITIPSSVKTIGERAFDDGSSTKCGLEVVNILNDEGEVVIHATAFTNRVNINYLGKKKAPKPAAEKITKEKKKETVPAKGASIDLEKLIQAALVDGVVTDKERAILIKKVKEAGGDTDEFEMLLDARIYEAQQKNAPKKEMSKKEESEKGSLLSNLKSLLFGKKEEPKEEEETTKEDKKVVEKNEEPKKEKETPKEVKQAAKTAGSNDPGREVWENMEKDVKPALQILDKLVAGMPYVQDGTYQINYDSKSYIGFAKNGKANNFATFAPQPKALVVNAWGMADSEEIENVGKALPNFEHKVTSRNVNYHTFKFSVDKAPTAEQTKAALTILEMARKNYEK